MCPRTIAPEEGEGELNLGHLCLIGHNFPRGCQPSHTLWSGCEHLVGQVASHAAASAGKALQSLRTGEAAGPRCVGLVRAPAELPPGGDGGPTCAGPGGR